MGLLSGCSPNTDSSGSGDSPSATEDGDGSGGTETSVSPESSEDDAATSAGGTGGSSGEPACEEPDTQVLWAADGELMDPMGFGMSDELGGIAVARSWAAEQGTLTLRFELACDGPVYLWGLVYDQVGGTMVDNADSFYVATDDDPESIWFYGCDSPVDTMYLWQWSQIDAWNEIGCDSTPLVLDLPAGEHALRFRNREGGVDTNVAVIAAVVVSHDPTTDPLQYLDPANVAE